MIFGLKGKHLNMKWNIKKLFKHDTKANSSFQMSLSSEQNLGVV